jgi:hypothetical protein
MFAAAPSGSRRLTAVSPQGCIYLQLAQFCQVNFQVCTFRFALSGLYFELACRKGRFTRAISCAIWIQIADAIFYVRTVEAGAEITEKSHL